MKKIILSAIVCFGLGVNLANAEETNIPTVAAVFQMNTTDQASVAAAFGKFAQSDCRKSMPAGIRIMQETFNGDEDISHSVIWNFADAKAMTQSFGALGQCRAWADTAAVLSQQVEFKSQQLMITLAAGGDYTKDSVYVIWQMNISDESTYLAAYEKLMKAQIEEGVVTGAYGLWRVQGGANSDVTHVAFSGAADMETLLSNSTPSKSFVAFQKKVAGLRKVHRRNINVVMADL